MEHFLETKKIYKTTLFGLCAVILFIFGWHETTLIRNTEDLRIQTQNLTASLELTNQKVAALIEETDEGAKARIAEKVAEAETLSELESKLLLEAQKRASLELKFVNETGLSASKIKELEMKLANEYDLIAIIKEWRPRMAILRCRFDGKLSTSSGILFRFIDGGTTRYGVLTNRHVVSDSLGLADDCTVELPDSGGIFVGTKESGTIEVAKTNYDFGRVLFTPNTYVTTHAVEGSDFCSDLPPIGDAMIILGYPLIGSVGDITATDGIISGYEAGYIITSAKVEKGNSGGAGILLRDNCLLGMPTFVQLGVLESLARLLDIRLANESF